jgi:hypothetical protein
MPSKMALWSMRFLTVIASPSIAGQVERCLGSGRIRPLGPDESPDILGVERFAAVIVDQRAPIETLRRNLPVVLVTVAGRPGLVQFRSLAEAGIDVRYFMADREISEPTLHALSAQRAPTPAAIIASSMRGQFDGLAADVVTATALLGDSRRSMDEIARSVDSSSTLVRNALREAGAIGVSGLLARMRCLHALWAREGGRTNFWSSAGFRTLAEVSEFFARHTGAPIGRWRVAGGFNALLRELPAAVREERELGQISS